MVNGSEFIFLILLKIYDFKWTLLRIYKLRELELIS